MTSPRPAVARRAPAAGEVPTCRGGRAAVRATMGQWVSGGAVALRLRGPQRCE